MTVPRLAHQALAQAACLLVLPIGLGCLGELTDDAPDGGPAPPIVRNYDASPGTSPDAGQIEREVDAGFDGGVDAAAPDAGGPPSCDTPTSPPSEGLRLWLDGTTGIGTDGSLTWQDRFDSSRVARVASGSPQRAMGHFGGIDGVRFDGDGDRLEVSAPIDGRFEATLALVSTSAGRAPDVEWCCRNDETGCSGTYHTAMLWRGARDWGGVYLGPNQREVSIRFGIGLKTYTEGGFYESEVFGPGGYGTCDSDPARDPGVAYLRPEDIGERPTLTVARLQANHWTMFVDGEQVWERDSPGSESRSVDAAGPLTLGEGFYGRSWAGVLGAVVVYDRALDDAEIDVVQRYLSCEMQLDP